MRVRVTCFAQDATDDVRTTQSSDVTSAVTSSSPDAEIDLSAKRKSGADEAAVGGAAGCHGDRMTPSGVVKDERDAELSMTSSVTSLRELGSAAAAGRTTEGKLDDVKAR